MMLTKVKIDKAAKAKFKQYLEELNQESKDTMDLDTEMFLTTCYFIGLKALQEETFIVVRDEETLEKRIIVTDIPDAISKSWTC
jgi:hypothetical protein